jgi:hypothetical protein
MAVMMTRIHAEDYDAWKPHFYADAPQARREAKSHRLYRAVDDPNEVLVAVEFDSLDRASAARERLLASGVLDRVTVVAGPTIVEEAEAVVY